MAHEYCVTIDATSETLPVVVDESHRYWNVWKTADRLEEAAPTFYPTLTPRVVSILRQWASIWAGQPEWRSLLNKTTLLHEIEESIVAIYHYLERTSSSNKQKSHIVVDMCGGKGIFSFLLSYLRPPNVDHIILLEKATAINWHHIEAANTTQEAEGRPRIILWPNTNLHEYDVVLDRLLALELPLAVTGIHLCKNLGPSFCGLVNGLGPRCLYACLAPCCLPRAVTAQKNNHGKKFALTIQCQEIHHDRQTRLDYRERRERLKRKPVGGPCFYCHDETHGIKDCSVMPMLPSAQRLEISQAYHAATIPCWNCLEFGHYKRDCPSGVEKAAGSFQAPTMSLNVSQVLQTSQPYTTYCHLLARSLQHRAKVDVVETELENNENHQDGNWNSQRKAIFIIAS